MSRLRYFLTRTVRSPRRWVAFILIWLALLAWQGIVTAQPQSVEFAVDDSDVSGRLVRVYRFDQENGLPTRNIWGILRSPDQFVWIASDKGLIRFDGDHFITFDKSNAGAFFEDPEFRRIRYFGEDLHLISELGGVLRFDLETYQAQWVTREATVDMIVVPDGAPRQGAEFFLLADGTARLRLGAEVLWERRYASLNGSRAVYLDRSVYFSVPAGPIMRLDLDTFDLVGMPLADGDLVTGYNEDLYAVADTLITFTSAGKIHLSSHREPFALYPTPSLSPVSSYLFDEALHRNVEIGWQAVVADNTFYYRVAIDKPWNPVSSVFAQNKQIRSFTSSGLGLFFITTNQGLTVVQTFPSGVRHIADQDVKADNGVRIRRQVIEGADGDVYLFGNPGILRLREDDRLAEPYGVEVVVNNRQQVYYSASPLQDGFIATIEGARVERLDRYGRRVRATEFRESIPGTESMGFQHHSMVHVISPDSLVLGGNGGIVLTDIEFAASEFLDLSRWIPGDVPEDEARTNLVTQMVPDPHRNGYWVAMEKGVMFLDRSLRQVERMYPAADPRAEGAFTILQNHSIHPVLLDSGGDTLWIGGDKGVDVIDLATGTAIRHLRYPLSTDPVQVAGLLEDDEGRIWASTFEGLMVIDPRTWDVWAMNTSHGLLNVEYNYKALHKLRDGQFIFGGLNGYDVVRPGELQFPDEVTPARISALVRTSADSSMVTPLPFDSPIQEFELVVGEEVLELLISESNIEGSLQNRTEYRFGGGAWSPLSQEKRILLIYTTYGEHSLQLRTRNAYGLVSGETRDYVIRATLPFTRSNTFLLGTTLTIFLLTLALLLYGYLYSKRELNLRRKIAMDLHDEIGSVLTRTILFTERLVQSRVRSGGDADASQVERVLKNLKQSVFSLRLFIKSLTYGDEDRTIQGQSLKEMVFNAFEGTPFTASCTIHVAEWPDSPGSQMVRDMEMCLFELTTNTLKHSDGNRVWVKVRSSPSGLVLTYSDNGSIRSLEGMGNGAGYGLRNLDRRMWKYGSSVNTTLRDEGNGLCVELHFQKQEPSRRRTLKRWLGLENTEI